MLRFPIATSVLADAIQQRVFPGAAFGVLHSEEQFAVESVGEFTYEPGSPRVQTDTLFDVASVGKAMATTSMAMLLWQRGQLHLDEPIGRRFPGCLQVGTEPENLAALRSTISPRMLLAHCSGLPAYAPLYKTRRTASELLEACLHMPLESAPGSRAVYSDIGFILLGHLLEQIAGERLDSFCRREIFAPLDALLPSRGTQELYSSDSRQGKLSRSNSPGRSSRRQLLEIRRSQRTRRIIFERARYTSPGRLSAPSRWQHFSSGNNFTIHNPTAHAFVFRLGFGLGYADRAFFVRNTVQRSFCRPSRLYGNFALA